MWPYPQKHTNINPDTMYHAKEIISTPSSTPKVELGKITDRPVLNMACIVTSDLLPMEKDRLEKMIKAYMDEQQLSSKFLNVSDQTIILALDTEIALMDIIRTIWNSTAPFKPEKPIRVGLHIAPVYVNSTSDDASIKLLNALGQFTPKGSICSSISFAAVLALHPKKFQLDYVGVIQLPEETQSNGLYKVSLK
jgi:hypothetical protein